MNATVCFVAPNEIAVLDPDNPERSQIAQFPGGQFLARVHLAARAAAPATESKYLVVRGSDKQNEVRLFDWDAGRTLKFQEEYTAEWSEDGSPAPVKKVNPKRGPRWTLGLLRPSPIPDSQYWTHTSVVRCFSFSSNPRSTFLPPESPTIPATKEEANCEHLI